jgi:hypothetical protein
MCTQQYELNIKLEIELNTKISNKFYFQIIFHISSSLHLVCICILYFSGVLMSRSKSNTKTAGDNSSFVSQTTATMLLQAGIIDYCLTLLKDLLHYWKRYG